jgi:peroxiredoxin Q/BCP
MINFSLPSHSGSIFTLNQEINSIVVIFFYPRDNTSGCTLENQDFANLYPEFKRLGVEVVGISRDSIKSHCKFAEKFNLPFMLLSDEQEEVCKLFNVIKDKKMYGKDVRGIERSTFVIKNNQIIQEWRKVKVENHANEVLEFIKTIC